MSLDVEIVDVSVLAGASRRVLEAASPPAESKSKRMAGESLGDYGKRLKGRDAEIAKGREAAKDAKKKGKTTRSGKDADFECVPWRAEALTRDGFVPFAALSEGDEILAYDAESDETRWTPVRAINVYPDAPTVRLSNGRASLEATENHRWITKGDARWGGKARVRTVAEFAKRERIVMAAPAPGGDLDVSDREAAILGWLFGDGCVTPYYVGKFGPYLRGAIYQSKPEQIEHLRGLTEGIARERVRQPVGYDGGEISGRQVVAKMEAREFFFAPSWIGDLFARAGITSKAEAPRVVSRLSASAREAMLDGLLRAEGTAHGEKGARFYQNPGPVLDAFLMLCALTGRATGRVQTDARSGGQRVQMRGTRLLDRLKVEPAGSQPVWCPTTDLGSWVMRLDGQVVITGNSQHPRGRGGSWTLKAGGGQQDEDAVRAVQRKVGADADGKFGGQTKAKVMAFQRKNGLQVDGVIGAQTLAALSGKKGKVAPGKAKGSDFMEFAKRGKAAKGGRKSGKMVRESLGAFADVDLDDLD